MNRETELEDKISRLKEHKNDSKIILELIKVEISKLQDELDDIRINREPIEGDSDYIANNKQQIELIKKFFSPKESERIIKLIGNNGIMIRSAKDTNYILTQRALRKLKTARKLLEIKEIYNLIN